MKKNLLPLLTLLLLIASCSKTNDTNEVEPDPVITGIGVPDGAVSTATIGPAGGTLSSSDGNFDLLIPAGAVTTPTSISIQPITNQCPNGLGKAFRCLPDGFQFAKPVTVVVHYTEEEQQSTNTEYMSTAYQNADRQWQIIESVDNDSSANTISFLTEHFTDFSAFDMLSIFPPSKFAQPGETVSFKLFASGHIIRPGEDLLGSLLQHPLVWSVNGVKGGNATLGTIAPVAGNDHWLFANYIAPATAPPGNEVTVSADLEFPFVVDGKTFQKGTVLAKVFFAGNRYKLRIEISDSSACNYYGQREFDWVEMEIIVKGDEVSVTDISNHGPTLTPATIFSGDGVTTCQIDGQVGQTGFFNILSGFGVVVENPFTLDRDMTLNLLNSGSTSNNCTVTCPGLPPVVAPSVIIPDYDQGTIFKDDDTPQTQGIQGRGFYYQLTPIH